MHELLTAAQMQAIERAEMDRGAVTGLDLMERAGRGVVEAIFAKWPDLAAEPKRAVVLCGPGNNGGDGFVIARVLKEWGWVVEVFLYGDAQKLPPDAKTNYERWTRLGTVWSVLDEFDKRTTWQGCDLVVDALFGTGLTRPLEDLTQVLMNLEDAASLYADPIYRNNPNFQFPRVVAVDIPSGIDADSGRPLEPSHGGLGAAAANLTASFHRQKLGHILSDGPLYCGDTTVVDIGLDDIIGRREGARGYVPTVPAEAIAKLVDEMKFAASLSKDGTHKYDHGHALVLSGPMGRSGAARLAARGALRVGAGLVTVAAPGSAMMECAAQLTAIMLRRCDDGAGLEALLEDTRFNALCLGPGLGLDAEATSLVSAALTSGRACVLDADALTLIGGDPDLFGLVHRKCVLTPHGGEFARLFPEIAAKLAAPPTQGPAYSKVDAARDAAALVGATVLFKGPDTVIAGPDGQCSVSGAVYDRAAPWLATAGSGDVLAGLIAGLLARGLGPGMAAEAAAWLHVEAARAFGPGLIAEDLPEMLPEVLARLAP